MADDYITHGEFEKRLQTTIQPDYISDADIIREAVSRAADNYIQVAPGYFLPSTVSTTKRIYGTGASFLSLPLPIRGSVTVVPAPGYTAPNFTLDENRFVTLTEEGYREPLIVWERIYYDITGLWGFAAIPPELKEACLQIGTRFWKGRDEGFSGVIGLIKQDGTIIERSIPAPARFLLDGLRQRLTSEVSSIGGSFYIA